MKKSEQAKASKGVDGVDRVSNLPDPVLHLILSGLPTTEEIIRSSILSRRWRYLWTSIPRIDVDYSRVGNPEQAFERNKFTEFVDRVLLNSSLDLDSFRLSCEDWCSMSTVGRWIHAAVTRNVKQLHLVFRPRRESGYEYENQHDNIEMPDCLVTCCSLEVLRLFLLRSRLSLPNFTGFPSLRVLELKGVGLSDADIVKAFFTSCPLLEDLSLIDCEIKTLEFLCISSQTLKNLRINNGLMTGFLEVFVCRDLEISCPKLVFLELTGTIAKIFAFDCLNSLKKAVIQPKFSAFEPVNGTECELFARISHVESLSINHSFLLKCIDPEVDVSLPNLKTLELTLDCGEVDVALRFLKCLPALESLHLNIISDTFTEKFWKLKEATTWRILTQQLKRVVLIKSYGEKRELDIARFFLEHGKALEKMAFCWDNKARFKESSMETMKKVSKFHKASPTVKLTACEACEAPT